MTTDDSETDETDRDDALADLRAVRERARYKTFGSGRIRDEGKAQIRVKYLRLVIQAANAERRLLKDKDLDELRDRVERLESGRSAGGPRDGEVLAAGDGSGPR
jgi:hypothetical protein